MDKLSDNSLGILACLATVVCWTAGTFAFTNASRIIAPASVNRVRLLLAAVIVTCIACFAEWISPLELLQRPDKRQLLYFGISGFIGFTLGDYFMFTAFKILGGRRATLFNCFAPVSSLIMASILVDERISTIGISGMVISVMGVLILTLSRAEQAAVHEEGHGKFIEGIVFGTLGAICQGIGLVLSKKGFMVDTFEISAIHATSIRLLTATVSVYIIGLFRVNIINEFKSIAFNLKKLKPVIAGTMFGPVTGVTLSLYATSKIEVSVAQTILSLVPVSTTIAAAVFYKEKLKLVSYLAVIVSVIGVLILIWRHKLMLS